MDITYKFLRTLRAAELAYEAGDDGRKPEIPDWRRPEVRDDWRLLDGYEVVETFSDRRSGFKAVAFETTLANGRKHRIYAVAGAEASVPDTRDAASALGLGRKHNMCL